MGLNVVLYTTIRMESVYTIFSGPRVLVLPGL